MIQRTVIDDVMSVVLVLAIFTMIMGMIRNRPELSFGGLAIIATSVIACTCLHWGEMNQNTP